RQPHLVVTDWMMPEMDGIELVRTLRSSEEGRQMQVILLTGREEEARVIEAFDAGADEYMIKPLNPRILMARVRSVGRVVAMREQINQDAKKQHAQMAELAVLSRRMHMASLTDTLTDLPNRRHAMERLQQELAQSQRDGTPLSVIMIDIDFFKKVNDEHGHDTGDVVLREVARSLRGCIRATELVCRLGGEEFLVICPRATDAKARLIAERMRLASESNVIQQGTFARAITLSLGVAELDRNDPSVDRMLKVADERTYQAKQAGRNRVIGGDLSSTSIRAAG
ncbi:MAG: diguanylate cyclase, partial [Planctomycetota bacterium]